MIHDHWRMVGAMDTCRNHNLSAVAVCDSKLLWCSLLSFGHLVNLDRWHISAVALVVTEPGTVWCELLLRNISKGIMALTGAISRRPHPRRHVQHENKWIVFVSVFFFWGWNWQLVWLTTQEIDVTCVSLILSTYLLDGTYGWFPSRLDRTSYYTS